MVKKSERFEAMQKELRNIEDRRFTLINDNSAFNMGTHGSVLTCEDKKNKRMIALKRIEILDEDNGVQVHAIREIAAYKKIPQHNNILYLYEVFMHSNRTYIVFQKMDCCLKTHLKQNSVSRKDKCLLKKQISEGLLWCHEHDIMHRDIKPQNILVNVEEKNAKICDFGLAKRIGLHRRTHSLEVVTLWYKAIELLLGNEKYNESIDIWSLGCVFFEIDTGKPLFMGDSEIGMISLIYRLLGNPNEKNFPGVSKLPYYNKDIRFTMNTTPLDNIIDDLTKDMLSYNSKSRPSLDDIILRL
tara:strand:+ start:526 stop:1425 length:900 start_codon:yes stop_codon:yes gene_type:complete